MNESYRNALDYLYTFVNFEHKRIDQYTSEHIDPARPARLLALLGDPHQRYPAIHIAGTKGKGSVAAMCAFSLRAAGLKVGLYTSPHLTEFRERFRVLTPGDADGRISEPEFVEVVNQLKGVVQQVPGLTWFELVTAVGFLYFARREVDVAVVEVGLGGRLDATNVITPLVSVITSLSLDHTDLLGSTLVEIAAEKGGIIKPGIPVVTAPQPADALARLQTIAQEKAAPLIIVGRDYTWEAVAAGPGSQQIIVNSQKLTGNSQRKIRIPLAGGHQQENGVVALAALDVVGAYFPTLTAAAVAEGMAAVQWPGRLQTLHQAPHTPTILLDSAHNPHSAKKLADALRETYTYRRLYLVLGITADKNVAGILQQLLPLANAVFVTRADHPRAAVPEDLQRLVVESGYQAQSCATVAEALQMAWKSAGPGDLICVTGSIFVIGDLLNQWDRLQSGFGEL